MAPPLVSPQLDEGRVADLEEKSLMKMLSSMVESVEPPHFRPSVASTDLHPCARALEDASDLDGFLFQSIFDRDGSGLTALHVLAGASHLDSLRQVLDAGADPDLVGGIDLQRPLHIAVKSGSLCSVQCLLEAGANANALDAFGKSPLYYALNLDQVGPGLDRVASIRHLLRKYGAVEP
ncbi:unnamed protein product [Effrenium voratum]|uniref:Uncharacterized protein n=1 Tax=Effrenium voratum TaxID=2562239 RepID=A0AA36IXK8_9DINO|nr:unnamed protein product [Effrenium voratum]